LHASQSDFDILLSGGLYKTWKFISTTLSSANQLKFWTILKSD